MDTSFDRPAWLRRRAERLARLDWLHTDTSGGRTVRYARDEILIDSAHVDDARAELRRRGATRIDVEALPGGFARIVAPGARVTEARDALRDRHGEGAASHNHVFSTADCIEIGGPFGPPSVADAYELAARAGTGGVSVAVLDTGVWRDSPLPESWYRAGAGDYATDGLDHADTGHANFIIGVIMAGTAGARIRVEKLLDADGTCREHELARKLFTLAASDVAVVNLSLGGYTADDTPPRMLTAALTALLAGRDRVVVAAAGNDGIAGRPYWPAAFAGSDAVFARQVVAVAAHDGTEVCSWSNTGAWVTLAAPGAGITSTFVRHPEFPSGFARWSGTSFAAPHVVAAVVEAVAEAGTVTDAADTVRKIAGGQLRGTVPSLS